MRLSDLFLGRVLTISNFLSLLRILLLLLLWYQIKISETNPKLQTYALVTMLTMGVTDFLDGFLSRKLGQETPLGQYLDPAADKIAIIGTLFLLWHYRSYPLSMVVLIIIREILGSLLGIFLLVKRDMLGQANYWGKWGVALVSISAIFYLLRWPYKEITIFLAGIIILGGVAVYSKTYWNTVFEKN